MAESEESLVVREGADEAGNPRTEGTRQSIPFARGNNRTRGGECILREDREMSGEEAS